MCGDDDDAHENSGHVSGASVESLLRGILKSQEKKRSVVSVSVGPKIGSIPRDTLHEKHETMRRESFFILFFFSTMTETCENAKKGATCFHLSSFILFFCVILFTRDMNTISLQIISLCSSIFFFFFPYFVFLIYFDIYLTFIRFKYFY